MSTDSEHDTHDGNVVKTSPIDSSPSNNSESVASVSRTVLNTRRKGVRKSNSGGSMPSSTKTRKKAIERTRSASNTKLLSPNPQKLRSKLSSRMKMDSSIDTTSTPTSEEGSTGSFSLGSSEKSHDSIVKSEIARINGINNKEPASPFPITRITSKEQSIDPLDQKQRRTGLRRNGSRSSEICEQLDPGQSPHSRVLRKSGSRSSDISELSDIAPPPHTRASPYLRGRKKIPSEVPLDESHRSSTSTVVRSKSSKQSSSSKAEEAIEGASTHSERRKTRSKSRASGGGSGKQRSSSGKSVKNGDKNKRHSRRSRTPSSKKGPTPSNSDSSADREKNKVTEEEILQLLDETPQKPTRVKRQSKSPAPDTLDATQPVKRSAGKHRVQQRRRSISSGAIETTRTSRRYSNEGGKSVTKEKRTRRPPGRTRSNNVGVDSVGLDSFLKQGSGNRRKKTSDRSVLSGSKSVSLSGSRTVYSTMSVGNRPRRRHLKSSNSLRSELRSDLSPRTPSRFARPKFSDSEEPIFESDDEDSDDDDSLVKMDLDLATARDNFKQQNLNEKLQQHLTKTDELLYSVFPKHIADALRNGQKVAPENHDLVTIFFSDIVGFTDISAKLDPLKISDMLDRLYNSFDALSDYHDVFKVETIGDAYMAVTNLTKEQSDHCKRITEFAVDAIRVANQTLIDEDNPSMGFVNIRVGFHSGSVVSNVVGTRNPRYCLFGDTVNTASRMESNSEKNRIHCSEISASLLRQQSPRVRIFPRGSIEVKGKGEMNTFWVHTEGSFQPRPRNKGTFSNFMEKVRKR